MATIPAHSRIISEAARRTLAPLGVRQRGRSRTWLDDHGWWLVVVEFQPSSWAKGAYLNVGAMWLWQRTDHISFDYGSDYGSRVEGHREFRDETSFAADAAYLADRAAAEVLRYRALFPDIASVAKVLQQRRTAGDWSRYHAAIAAALAGQRGTADAQLAALAAEASDWDWQLAVRAEARELRTALRSPEVFRARVSDMVQSTRTALKLPEWEGSIPVAL